MTVLTTDYDAQMIHGRPLPQRKAKIIPFVAGYDAGFVAGWLACQAAQSEKVIPPQSRRALYSRPRTSPSPFGDSTSAFRPKTVRCDSPQTPQQRFEAQVARMEAQLEREKAAAGGSHKDLSTTKPRKRLVEKVIPLPQTHVLLMPDDPEQPNDHVATEGVTPAQIKADAENDRLDAELFAKFVFDVGEKSDVATAPTAS